MAEIPWKSFAKVSPDREYLVLITYLPLNRFWVLPRFLAYTRSIQIQLNQSRGLIGYALKAAVLRLRFWALSVWEDENSLMEFVRNQPHGQVMGALTPHMGETKFVRWNIAGSAVPPTWHEAISRLSAGSCGLSCAG